MQLILELDPYIEELTRTRGATKEFVNPKYKDKTKTSFKSSTRLECMMQDYPKTLSPSINSFLCGLFVLLLGFLADSIGATIGAGAAFLIEYAQGHSACTEVRGTETIGTLQRRSLRRLPTHDRARRGCRHRKTPRDREKEGGFGLPTQSAVEEKNRAADDGGREAARQRRRRTPPATSGDAGVNAEQMRRRLWRKRRTGEASVQPVRFGPVRFSSGSVRFELVWSGSVEFEFSFIMILSEMPEFRSIIIMS